MPTRAPRVAAHEAFESEGCATASAVRLQRFKCIGGASGREAAVATQPRAEEPAVTLHEANEEALNEVLHGVSVFLRDLSQQLLQL